MQKKTQRLVGAFMEEADIAALDDVCEEYWISRSHAIREAIAQWVRRETRYLMRCGRWEAND